MNQLDAEFTIVTPMFIGGMDQKPEDGIRPPSVKGALRFWWRALNWGGFRQSAATDALALQALHREEARLFGIAANDSDDRGQGCFLLRVSSGALEHRNEGDVHRSFSRKPAARYLGYGLMVASGRLERGCITEGQRFTVSLAFRGGIEATVQEALIAWGMLGALGSRSRHGMGSIALTSMQVNGKEIWSPPSDEGIYADRIKALFRPDPPGHRRHLPATEPPFSAFWEGSRIDRLLSGTDSYGVLDAFGSALLMYRSWGRTSMGNRLPGGVSEMRFKHDHGWCRVPGWRAANPNFHPERVVFGLPHHYGQAPSDKVKPEHHDRRASPLFFHVHAVGDMFVGVSIYLPALFLPASEGINAGGAPVPAIAKWSVITDLLDGDVGNPPAAAAVRRFPGKSAMLPVLP